MRSIFQKFLFVMLLCVTTAFGLKAQTATLTSDQPDYAPGDIATLTGAGFQTGEQVRMQVLHADGTPATGADHDPWYVTADANGGFVTTWHVCEDDCVGSTLRATADGQSSGLHAEVLFTDGNVKFQTTGLPNGTSVTVSVTYDQNGSAGITTENVTFLSQGSGSVSAENSTSVSYTYPQTIVSGVVTYVLTSTSPTSPFISENGSTTVIGTYTACVSPAFTACPTNISTNTTTGSCAAVLTYTAAASGTPAPTYTYSFSGATTVATTSGTGSGSSFNKGTTNVTITATNSCGTATCSFTVTVNDNEAPTITCPDAITVACGASTLPASTGTATATDNCGSTVISYTDVIVGSSPCQRIITRTWTATDGATLTATCVQTITVSPAALPTMTALAAITVACGGVPAASTISFSNGLSGGCLISGTSNPSTFTTTPGACGGPVTETWTATDACGRTVASVSRTITVSPAALPTMTALAATTVVCGTVFTGSTLPFNNGLTGNCAISGTSATSTFSAQTPAGACGGIVIETWTATDACGRAVASVSRNITVSPAALPTMTAPGPTTVACGTVFTGSTLSFSNGLTGGCEISGTSNTSTFSSQTPAGACGGTVTETWTATDACGRALASVSRTIIVSPAALPTMTASADITVACGSIPASSTISFSNGLSGGCLISGTSNPSTFTTTPISGCGTVTETWTAATDACGRTIASVSRTITVVDNTAPVITACAPDVTLAPNNAGCTVLLPDYTSLAVATDNCSGVVTKTQSPAPGTALPTGPNTVTITATDACGNSSSCNFTVTVTSTLAASCSTNNTQLYFGLATDQTATITAIPSGGTGPYTVVFTMSRPLKCNVVNADGDETWSAVTPAPQVPPVTVATVIPVCTSPPGTGASTPVSTFTGATAGNPYSVTVKLMANALITATITDAYGCVTTCSTQIYAEDVRCFNGSGKAKVQICHRTNNGCHEICVDDNAVPAHLAHGDFLGMCTLGCVAPQTYVTAPPADDSEVVTDDDKPFKVLVSPNPTTTNFKMVVESITKDPIHIRIFDAVGRIVKVIPNASRNSVITVGDNFRGGNYFVEVIQGDKRKTVKLIKLN